MWQRKGVKPYVWCVVCLCVLLCASGAYARRRIIVKQQAETITVPEPAPLETSQQAATQPQQPAPQQAASSAPRTPSRILQATGTLEALNAQGISLSVFGTLYTNPLSGDCVFLDERRGRMDPDAFVRRYLRRYVTVELEEDSGAVVSCRVGS